MVNFSGCPDNSNPAGNGALLLVKSFLREMVLKELRLNKVSFLTRGCPEIPIQTTIAQPNRRS